MLNVCPICQRWTPEKKVDRHHSTITCPECQGKSPFQFQPLFVLGGASGAGKTATCTALTGHFTEVVVLDADILWMDYFHDPAKWPEFFDLWLRLCKNISQSGRPVLLCGAGMAVPANLQASVEHRYFSAVHYMALTCDEEVLAERLRARPAWRGIDEPFIESQIEFNRWLKEEGPTQEPPITLLDTTAIPVEESVQGVMAWVRNLL